MKKSINRINLLIIIICIGFSAYASTCEAIMIEYIYNGKLHQYVGEKIHKGKYIFGSGQSEKITMATLKWQPYIGENICGQGWVQQMAVGIFLSLGYTVETRFYPWKRAVMNVERGDTDILYPEYFIPEAAPSDTVKGGMRRNLLAMSDPFPGGPVVFWRKKGNSVEFKGDLRTLRGVSVGVVDGYENTPEFDRLMAQGYFKVDKARNDWINIKKLYYGRISLIVGDQNVLAFTVRKELPPEKAETYLSKLESAGPPLSVNPLYLAFSKNRPKYRKHLNRFNSRLKEFTESGEADRLRQKYSCQSHLKQECVSLSGADLANASSQVFR